MLRGITAEEYIRKVDKIEADAGRDRKLYETVEARVTEALQSGDVQQLLEVNDLFASAEGREASSRFASLLQLRYILGAIENERALSLPLFSEGVSTFEELTDKFQECNLMLRRIEFGIEPGREDALSYIRDAKISPYAAAAVLYSMTSALGHRESVLSELAGDALENGNAMLAYGFLSVIEQPGEETKSLKEELYDAIRRAAL